MEGGIRCRTGKFTVIEDREEEIKKKPQQSSISWTTAVCWSLLATLLVLPVIIWLLPSPIEPISFSLPSPPEWTGPLAPNTDLQKTTKLYEGKVLGAESMVLDGEYMYAGTADGKIVEIHRGEIRVLTQLGTEPCGRFEDEPTCGRPLGMRLDKAGYLIVADAYLGLFRVNVATGDKTELWSSTKPINGKLPRLLNDVEIGPDGLIYVTDSSTKWDRRHNRYLIMEGETTGRLLVYRPDSGSMDEIVSGIAFANGLQLTRDKKHLLLVSTTKASVYKYGIEGADKGKLEVFKDNLPGLPDNIRRSKSGGYWVGIAVVRRPKFSLFDFASERPWFRKLAAKIHPFVSHMFVCSITWCTFLIHNMEVEHGQKMTPADFDVIQFKVKATVTFDNYQLLSQDTISNLAPKYGLLIHLNEAGEITRSLHDPTAEKMPAVSEVEDRGDVLFFGSYYLPYIGKLYLSSIKT